VLDLSGEVPIVLRPGAITGAQLLDVIGPIDVFYGSVDPAQSAISPGQHAIHYSPRATAYRFTRDTCADIIRWCQDNRIRYDVDHGGTAAVICIGRLPDRLEWEPSIYFDKVLELPISPQEYARDLYAALRQVDQPGTTAIFVEMPPDESAWAAVRDRLTRATRPLIPSIQ
jgi:L-threonylcarbamoyladenylate synthase